MPPGTQAQLGGMDKGIVVGVAIGRNHPDPFQVWQRLDNLNARQPISRLVVGDGKGADSAVQWAVSRGIDFQIFPADWRLRGAGAQRGRAMTKVLDYLVAFDGGKGTEMEVGMARKKGIPIDDQRGQFADYPRTAEVPNMPQLNPERYRAPTVGKQGLAAQGFTPEAYMQFGSYPANREVPPGLKMPDYETPEDRYQGSYRNELGGSVGQSIGDARFGDDLLDMPFADWHPANARLMDFLSEDLGIPKRIKARVLIEGIKGLSDTPMARRIYKVSDGMWPPAMEDVVPDAYSRVTLLHDLFEGRRFSGIQALYLVDEDRLDSEVARKVYNDALAREAEIEKKWLENIGGPSGQIRAAGRKGIPIPKDVWDAYLQPLMLANWIGDAGRDRYLELMETNDPSRLTTTQLRMNDAFESAASVSDRGVLFSGGRAGSPMSTNALGVRNFNLPKPMSATTDHGTANLFTSRGYDPGGRSEMAEIHDFMGKAVDANRSELETTYAPSQQFDELARYNNIPFMRTLNAEGNMPDAARAPTNQTYDQYRVLQTVPEHVDQARAEMDELRALSGEDVRPVTPPLPSEAALRPDDTRPYPIWSTGALGPDMQPLSDFETDDFFKRLSKAALNKDLPRTGGKYAALAALLGGAGFVLGSAFGGGGGGGVLQPSNLNWHDRLLRHG